MASPVGFLTARGLAPIGPIEVLRTADGIAAEFLPQDRYENVRALPLNLHGAGPFCRFVLPKLGATPGVYAISSGDRVLYIGECQDFAERFGPRGYGTIHPRNCFRGGQSTNCKVNSGVLELHRQGQTPTLWFCPEGAIGRKQVEAELLRILAPPWNGR